MTPPRPILRVFWAFHRGLWAVSGHRLGATPPGARAGTLFLISTGRTSGAVRRNGLFYIDDGQSFVIVGSNAGADSDPAWWLNLQARPDVAVEIGRQTVPVRARLASGPERDRLWPRLVAANPPFAEYQAATRRVLPVVILEPRDA